LKRTLDAGASADKNLIREKFVLATNKFRTGYGTIFREPSQMCKLALPMPHMRKPPPAPAPHFEWRVPEGDTTERHVCGRCEYVHYINPKIVVGAVVSHGDHILLCRRAIEPRKNFWTLPAGYLEEHETPEDGARREAREEANAEIAIDALLAVYAVPHISQVQLMYRATLAQPVFSAGPESLDVALFAWDDIPWTELAFPSVKWALDHYRSVLGQAVFAPFSNPP
jgi:ADP-ribose pyrophosphatase YjhB (NUDIX family)